jgi:hypothetical protein
MSVGCEVRHWQHGSEDGLLIHIALGISGHGARLWHMSNARHRVLMREAKEARPGSCIGRVRHVPTAQVRKKVCCSLSSSG